MCVFICWPFPLTWLKLPATKKFNIFKILCYATTTVTVAYFIHKIYVTKQHNQNEKLFSTWESITIKMMTEAKQTRNEKIVSRHLFIVWIIFFFS